MNDDYKASKEAFVSGMTGSSVVHINKVSLSALISIALYCAVKTRLPPNRPLSFLSEVVLLVLPLIFSVTVFANAPGTLCLILLVPTIVIVLFFPRREAGAYLPSSLTHSRTSSRDTTPARKGAWPGIINIPPLPALTTYRSHMLLLTFICILAVDFPVFPRSLAKCETFGASMMDLGVGAFVFSQGIVSAIPLVKKPQHLTEPVLPKLSVILRKCSPVLLLGLLRTISVKGTEYPEHVTEYGVHWNFFITLAIIPVLQVLLHPLMVHIPISLLGVVVAISHQLALSAGGLQRFVLDAPRVGVISANKEGIVSLPGYLAIHLLGLSTGTLVLAPSPSYFRRRLQQLTRPEVTVPRPRTPSSDSDSDDDIPAATAPVPTGKPAPELRRENDKTATELCSYAVLWWSFLAVLRFSRVGGGISRRLVNMQYIFWVAAYNTTFLLGYLVLDLLFFPSPLSKSVYSPTSKLKVHPDPDMLKATQRTKGRDAGLGGSAPALLEAVNANGLVLFLLANVMTGLINLSMRTMYMSDGPAMLVISLYALGISAVAWACRHRRLWRF
ncbi:GWT1-domain-containing protein [Trametes punicea]|nr:GWT1-domain-containing protein [Trametes punicea]